MMYSCVTILAICTSKTSTALLSMLSPVLLCCDSVTGLIQKEFYKKQLRIYVVCNAIHSIPKCSKFLKHIWTKKL